MRKRVFLGVLIPAIAVLISLGGIKVFSNKTLEFSEFSEIVKSGNFDILGLTIYYLDQSDCTIVPLSESDLMKRNYYKYKIIVNDSDLRKHADILNQISNVELKLIEDMPLDARFCYIFENKKNGKKLRISMSGLGKSMYVNGSEVEQSRIFVELMIPFLPEEATKTLLNALNRYDYELDMEMY